LGRSGKAGKKGMPLRQDKHPEPRVLKLHQKSSEGVRKHSKRRENISKKNE